jgi:hypothetical protein
MADSKSTTISAIYTTLRDSTLASRGTKRDSLDQHELLRSILSVGGEATSRRSRPRARRASYSRRDACTDEHALDARVWREARRAEQNGRSPALAAHELF